MTDVYSVWDNVTNYNINNSIDVILFQTSSSSFLTDDEYNSTHVFCPSNYNSEPSTLTSVLNVILAILYSIVCLIGVFGNSLVIFVVVKFSKMQTVTNYYILNLAIADQCFLIGIPFLIFTMFYGQWIFGNWFCKLYMISQSITQLSTSYFLLIMSADRYIAGRYFIFFAFNTLNVCHPIDSPRYRNLPMSKFVSILLWAFSFLLMSPVILYANTIEKSENSSARSCIIKWNLDSGDADEPYAFILYSFFLGFALPLALILTFYLLVIKKLRTVRQRSKSKERKRSHRKVTKLVLIIIAMYVCFWSPYWMLQIYSLTLPPDYCRTNFEIIIFMLFGCLVYLNSSLNPLLYAFLSDSFKKSFLKACSCANKNDLYILRTDFESPIHSRLSKTRSSEKRHYTSVAMKVNRKIENRCLRKKEIASTAIADDSKEIILISTNTPNRRDVLQTDL